MTHSTPLLGLHARVSLAATRLQEVQTLCHAAAVDEHPSFVRLGNGVRSAVDLLLDAIGPARPARVAHYAAEVYTFPASNMAMAALLLWLEREDLLPRPGTCPRCGSSGPFRPCACTGDVQDVCLHCSRHGCDQDDPRCHGAARMSCLRCDTLVYRDGCACRSRRDWTAEGVRP